MAAAIVTRRNSVKVVVQRTIAGLYVADCWNCGIGRTFLASVNAEDWAANHPDRCRELVRTIR